jgi:hypothetical protein
MWFGIAYSVPLAQPMLRNLNQRRTEMKTSEVLRRVRLHLSDGEKHVPMHRKYICYALNYLYFDVAAIPDAARWHAKKLIGLQLAPYQTLEEWLNEVHGIPLKKLAASRSKIMATRKAWLTHLIEHYEAKGD